ncbi:hypothetical protein A3Q56_01940 [Intoshia linei]|uniref:Uncharacterized protein n=1 Tax=Intoshia linei TaxID=1819745 RepID=A0A177BA06_9BILA|nr:hypothetical protein A3Q56_01940 [Intoshia linei]
MAFLVKKNVYDGQTSIFDIIQENNKTLGKKTFHNRLYVISKLGDMNREQIGSGYSSYIADTFNNTGDNLTGLMIIYEKVAVHIYESDMNELLNVIIELNRSSNINFPNIMDPIRAESTRFNSPENKTGYLKIKFSLTMCYIELDCYLCKKSIIPAAMKLLLI